MKRKTEVGFRLPSSGEVWVTTSLQRLNATPSWRTLHCALPLP